MFPLNMYWFLIAALIPMLVGALYYSDMVFGKSWMKTNGFTKEMLEQGNMAAIFGTAYILSVILAFGLSGMVVHQGHVAQVMMPDVMVSGSEAQNQFNGLMEQYGYNFRTFGHGALHGAIVAVFLALPLIGINAMFERRGWKYIGIHVGYWLLTLTLMGGVLCKYLIWAPLS